jgi:hypothetical protein
VVRGRFTILLAALLALLFVLPFLGGTLFNQERFRILFTAVLAASVYALSRVRLTLVLSAAFVVPAVLGGWIAPLVGIEAGSIAAYSVGVLALFYTAAIVLRAVMREERVTADTILGGISVYLLVGIAFGVLFLLLEWLVPGSFMAGGEPLRPQDVADGGDRMAVLLYLSFVTIATLGYGDVTPNSEIARMLCAGEALFGQIYIAVFVALLVGMHVAARRNEP